MVVTLPASALREFATVPAQVTGLYGTIWHGSARLTGGYALNWDVRPWRLVLLRGVMDLRLEGADTQLTGIATLTPWSASARDISGRAGPGLLALVPGAGLSGCTSRAVVDIQSLRATRDSFAAGGVASIDAGSCIDLLGRATSVPQMTLDLSTRGDDARGVLRDRDGELAQVTLAGDRRLILRIEPEGATLVPGMPTSGPTIVEYPF